MQQSDDLARIQAIAELMAAGAEPHDVVDAVAQELRDCSGCATAGSRHRGRSVLVRPSTETATSAGGGLWWGVDTLGLPGKEISIEVEHDNRRLGRYVLLAEAGTRVRRDQLLTAVTLADQAGAALGASVPIVSLAHS